MKIKKMWLVLFFLITILIIVSFGSSKISANEIIVLPGCQVQGTYGPTCACPIPWPWWNCTCEFGF